MPTSTSERVVGLGQVTVEMLGLGPRSQETVIELATFSIQSGGAIGTELATVAALGGRARYFGRLSDDEFGAIVLRGLKEFGVDVASVLGRRRPNRPRRRPPHPHIRSAQPRTRTATAAITRSRRSRPRGRRDRPAR